MKLPSDFADIVRVGADTLRQLGIQVRDEASRRPDAPELWLAVRDFEGLAGRLASFDDREWTDGFAHLLFTGQDVGALNELLLGPPVAPIGLSDIQTHAIVRLRDFLDRYRLRAYDLDDG